MQQNRQKKKKNVFKWHLIIHIGGNSIINHATYLKKLCFLGESKLIKGRLCGGERDGCE